MHLGANLMRTWAAGRVFCVLHAVRMRSIEMTHGETPVKHSPGDVPSSLQHRGSVVQQIPSVPNRSPTSLALLRDQRPCQSITGCLVPQLLAPLSIRPSQPGNATCCLL